MRLRDVLFLAHPRPVDDAQAALWKRLAANELATPDTWEVALSTISPDAEGGRATARRAAWERLLAERKLGALALLRNLRNLEKDAVEESLVRDALAAMRTERVLPFRFLAAARVVPRWEEDLEQAMFRSLESRARLAGHTVLLVDISGSMQDPLSARSEMRRTDAAYGLAILLREIAERVTVFSFSERAQLVPPRRGMALRDAIETSQPHGGTYLGRAIEQAERDCRPGFDRMIVITDEQSHDRVSAPRGRGYVINVASAKNGVGFGPWMHIDGWSEAVIDYIAAVESGDALR